MLETGRPLASGHAKRGPEVQSIPRARRRASGAGRMERPGARSPDPPPPPDLRDGETEAGSGAHRGRRGAHLEGRRAGPRARQSSSTVPDISARKGPVPGGGGERRRRRRGPPCARCAALQPRRLPPGSALGAAGEAGESWASLRRGEEGLRAGS